MPLLQVISMDSTRPVANPDSCSAKNFEIEASERRHQPHKRRGHYRPHTTETHVSGHTTTRLRYVIGSTDAPNQAWEQTSQSLLKDSYSKIVQVPNSIGVLIDVGGILVALSWLYEDGHAQNHQSWGCELQIPV